MAPTDDHGDRRRGLRRALLALGALAAAAAVGAGVWAVDDTLHRPIELHHEDRAWELTPAEAGARPDVAAMAVAAWRAATTTPWAAPPDEALPLTAAGDDVDAALEKVARGVDRTPVPARLEVTGPLGPAGLEAAAARDGQRLDRDAAVAEVLAALASGGEAVALPVDEVAATPSTEEAERAVARLRAAVAGALEREVTLRHDERAWAARIGDLAPAAGLEEAFADALDGPGVDVEVRPGRRAVRDLADDIAEDLDRSVREAALAVEDDGLAVVEAREGHRLERGPAAREVVEAVAEGEDEVDLPIEVTEPRLRTAHAEAALPAAREAAEREISLVDGERAWQARPVDLAADVDATAAVEVAASGEDPDAGHVAVEVDEAAVEDLVDDVAGEIDRAARDASLNWSSGWVEVTEARDGRRLDRDAAAAEVAEAVAGGQERVELSVDVEPASSDGMPPRVLLLRQAERRLYLYEGGEIAASWPVAVGMAGHPTPTGEFTVGAKRHRPTWGNPSPDGWGADMPARVGPGPGNPLGVRALNWNRGGADTMIRFHGTPDTASIGQAASRGCVRLTNDHVRELYDRVPSGTPIVSVRG